MKRALILAQHQLCSSISLEIMLKERRFMGGGQRRHDPVSRPVPSRPGTGRDGIFKSTRDFQKLN